MIESKDKIGVFDSGMGGLTVLREIEKSLPYENIVYYADSKNCPYGDKTSEEILFHTRESVLKLINIGVKLIVIACNTATSSAIKSLRNEFSDVIFVAIEPAVKPATEITRNGNIAVIATQYTVNGERLKQLCEKYSENTNILRLATPKLVALVENNKENTPYCTSVLEEYFQTIIKHNIDTVVLGCTHYSFLRKDMEAIAKKHNIQILDAAKAIAKQTVNKLTEKEIHTTSRNKGNIEFLSSLDEEYNNKLKNKYIEYKTYGTSEHE
ncbi:MAG: glutamate racemase [Rikenellaceae bacterium]